MKTIRISIFIIACLILLSTAASTQSFMPHSRAVDFYRVKTAMLPKRKTFDFRLTTSYQTIDRRFKVPAALSDTLLVQGKSQLGSLNWGLSYAFNNRWEASISGISFYDENAGFSRYGAGDTKIALRYAKPNEESEYNFGMEAYYTIPTGFNEGDRVVRAFASDGGSFGANFFTDFEWMNWSAKVNGGYYHANGAIQEIKDPLNTFWYHSLSGINGITPIGEILNSSQAFFGFGLGRNFFFGTRLFSEYVSQTILTKTGDGKSLGNFAAGISLYNSGGMDIKFGTDIPLGENRTDPGYFLDIRLNGIIGGRRLVIAPEPVIPEEEPSLIVGRKPFFRREGVVYSRIREPIRDTVFIIDSTPSMLGRSALEGNRGEEVAKSIVEFIQDLIDSTADNSNLVLITFNDEINSLSWRSIDESKKEEIKNSVRDVPDEMNDKADEMETGETTRPWKELMVEAIKRGYEELESFRRGDYNRIHLQRIIVFSDGIDESTIPLNLEQGFNSIQRRYQLTRDDFRFFYYLHTNPKTEGAKIDDSIIRFGERENGKTFRSLDIANIDDQMVRELNYNGIARRSSLRYQSQITKMAVLDFYTKGLGSFSAPLVQAYKSVFNYNEYFVLKPQQDVQAVMSNEGMNVNQQMELADFVRVGKRLGVDYVVYGEVVKYEQKKGNYIYIPYLIGFPKTEMYIEVAIRLIDVAEGTIKYVNTIAANSGKSDGVALFPFSREHKMSPLSGVELAKLQKKLLENWSKKLKDSMFEDRSIVTSSN